MTSKLARTIALVFVICALQAHGIAVPGLTGKLRTGKNKPVLVNNNKAATGTTIVSGARIKCPNNVGATVELGILGRLDIAANTDLTLIFGGTDVRVQLRSGYVVLTTNKGISGVVTTSEGAVFSTDPAKTSSVIAKVKNAPGPETGVPVGASQGGGVGVAGAAAAILGGVVAAPSGGRGSDLSSDNPRRP